MWRIKNHKYLFWLLFFIPTPLLSSLSIENSVVSLTDNSFDVNSLSREIKLVYDFFVEKTLEDSNDDSAVLKLYTHHTEISEELRQKLFNKFEEKSHLYAFPDLDTQTFNELIKILSKEFLPQNAKLDALLYMWSYLTGVKVIGLKNTASYYKNNNHIKKHSKNFTPEEITLEFSETKLFAKKRDSSASNAEIEELTELPVATNFFLAAAYFKTRMGNAEYSGRPEDPTIPWDFLTGELIPLTAFSPCKKRRESSVSFAVLSKVLSLDSANKPLYCHGIVNILRNVAIYISEKESEDSRNIVGSFSIASTENLGLQDGVFIEKKVDVDKSIDYLLGCQLFNRLFFRNYREQIWRDKKKASGSRPSIFLINDVKSGKTLHKGPNCTEFVPHYEFHTVSFEQLNVFIDKGDNEFAKRFRSFVRAGGKLLGGGNHSNFNSPYTTFEDLFDELNKNQLKTRLLPQNELQRTVGTVWFEPESSVDGSGKSMQVKFSNYIADNSLVSALRPQVGEKLLPVSSLILHLKCYTFRFVEKLNLSGNYIGDTGAQELGKCFMLNVLPFLKVLDLSNNRVTDFRKAGFQSLLQRDNFLYLDVTLNPYEGIIPECGDPKFLNKLIFIPKESLNGPGVIQNVPAQLLENHENFYRNV